jgi:hypothetical protein
MKMESDGPYILIWLKITVSLCRLHSCIFSEIRAWVYTTLGMNIWNIIKNHSHTFKLLILPIFWPSPSIKVINMVPISLISGSKCFRMNIKHSWTVCVAKQDNTILARFGQPTRYV